MCGYNFNRITSRRDAREFLKEISYQAQMVTHGFSDISPISDKFLELFHSFRKFSPACFVAYSLDAPIFLSISVSDCGTPPRRCAKVPRSSMTLEYCPCAFYTAPHPSLSLFLPSLVCINRTYPLPTGGIKVFASRTYEMGYIFIAFLFRPFVTRGFSYARAC